MRQNGDALTLWGGSGVAHAAITEDTSSSRGGTGLPPRCGANWVWRALPILRRPDGREGRGVWVGTRRSGSSAAAAAAALAAFISPRAGPKRLLARGGLLGKKTCSWKGSRYCRTESLGPDAGALGLLLHLQPQQQHAVETSREVTFWFFQSSGTALTPLAMRRSLSLFGPLGTAPYAYIL